MGKEQKKDVFVIGGKPGWTPIKYSGIYDLRALMNSINSYLNSRRYNVIQIEHTEKVTAAGREIKIEIAPFRDVSDYVRFSINIIVSILRNIDVVVEENGRKVKRQEGDVDILVKAKISKNYKSTFSPTKGGELFRKTYEKYITKKKLEEYEDKLKAEIKELMNKIKETLRIIRD